MAYIDLLEFNISNQNLEILDILLQDRTTGGCIRWCTDDYADLGDNYRANQEMKPEQITGDHANIIKPRVFKPLEEQAKRTRNKAEVFTPTWIVNEQNNLVDDAWFGRAGAFNEPKGTSWTTTSSKIQFPKDKTWRQYVLSKRLEICCGEAPYLVSRYDATTGECIPIKDRVGILDRKLRVINENTENESEWQGWVIQAFQSAYGYEYYGDSVLLARENLLSTYIESMDLKFGKKPTISQQKEVAEIISYNIWQMDGITMTAPYSSAAPKYEQLTLFGAEVEQLWTDIENQPEPIPCQIFDWQQNKSIEFRSMLKE